MHIELIDWGRGVVGVACALVASCSAAEPGESPPPAAGGGAANWGGTGGEGTSGVAGEPSAVESLQRMLLGRFDSSAQAAAHPTYFAVRLVTCLVDVPALSERVLYVEQALVDNPGAPYRQRLYVLERGPDPAIDASSRVYELVHPSSFVGHCDAPPTPVTAEAAVERPGCRVDLHWLGDHFEGRTPGTECESDFQGASYATSEVALYEDRIESWDRGFDDDGGQVWGATAGPYVFVRQDDAP